MYYVYFLVLEDATIYKGMTETLQHRYKEHQHGKVESTRDKRPLRLIGFEAYWLKSDALRRERYLKTTEGRRTLRQQYRDVLHAARNHLDSSCSVSVAGDEH